jgi:hypothetical protein
MKALGPYLDELVVVGGWAHRLYELHAMARSPGFEPLMTEDADIAAPGKMQKKGESIAALLKSEGFAESFFGEDRPPVSEYRLGVTSPSRSLGPSDSRTRTAIRSGASVSTSRSRTRRAIWRRSCSSFPSASPTSRRRTCSTSTTRCSSSPTTWKSSAHCGRTSSPASTRTRGGRLRVAAQRSSQRDGPRTERGRHGGEHFKVRSAVRRSAPRHVPRRPGASLRLMRSVRPASMRTEIRSVKQIGTDAEYRLA